MSFLNKYKNALAGAVMAVGSVSSFGVQAKAPDNDVNNLDEPTVSVAQQSTKKSFKDRFEAFKQRQNQAMQEMEENEPVTDAEKAHARLDEGLDTMSKLGASNMRITQTVDGDKVTTTVSHNGEGVASLDDQGNVIVEQSIADQEAEAERMRLQSQWHDMNEKVGDHGVTAHTINKDIREIMAASQCSAPLSDENLLHSLNAEEVAQLYHHMQNLDPAHTLDANTLLQIAHTQCDQQLSEDVVVQLQLQAEVSKGEAFAKEHGLDPAQVNSDYEYER